MTLLATRPIPSREMLIELGIEYKRTYKMLAEQFGICLRQAHMIVKHKSWKGDAL